MLTGNRIAVVLVTSVIVLTMAIPVFAQEATPTPEPPAPTPTAQPTATATTDPSAVPTATPDTSAPSTDLTATPDAGTPPFVPAPTPTSSSGRETSDRGSKPIPAGQLTRRGIFGDVVRVRSSSITVSTKFGNVTVQIDSSTRIKRPPDGEIGIGDIQVGDRAGIHLNRAPVAEGQAPPTLVPPTATPTPKPIADATPSLDQTPTPTLASDATPSVDQTPTPTLASDATPSVDQTPTPTMAPDATPSADEPTATPTPEPTPTATPEPTSTPSEDATPTPTVIIDAADTATPTTDQTPTPTPIGEATPTADATPTPPAPTPTPIFVAPSFREVVARSVTVIPRKTTRNHRCTVVGAKCRPGQSGGKGKLKVFETDGTEIELDATCAEGGPEEGDDVILLKRSKGKGKGDEIRGSVGSDTIDERLEKLKGSASDDRKALLDELKAERDAKKQERLADLESKAPPGSKDKVTTARNKGKPADTGGGSFGGGGSGVAAAATRTGANPTTPVAAVAATRTRASPTTRVADRPTIRARKISRPPTTRPAPAPRR